jgi:putative ATPase
MPNIKLENVAPLAAKLRPRSLDDIIGQDHLLGEGKPLRKMANKKVFTSMVLFGPPGAGKTSLVCALANETNSIFHKLNATDSTVKDLRKVIEGAKKALPDQRTFVFVDEVHRWSKSQQDVMLPVIEDGTIVFFGATTERPKFAVNSTILSRCLVFEVKPLDSQGAIKLIIKIKEHYKELGIILKIEHEAAKRLINRSSGDARKIITALEAVIEVLSDDGTINCQHIDEVIPDKHLVFDSSGNDHFDLAHCYQEAIQNSDTDGAIYWLAKWLHSGEDPAYICRRMLITSFEDCAGNPNAWLAAMAACYTTEKTGLPECMIPMALATCEMGNSKRNKAAFYAIHAAMADVANGATVHVPPELRAGTQGYVHAITKKYVKGWKRDDATDDDQ